MYRPSLSGANERYFIARTLWNMYLYNFRGMPICGFWSFVYRLCIFSIYMYYYVGDPKEKETANYF